MWCLCAPFNLLGAYSLIKVVIKDITVGGERRQTGIDHLGVTNFTFACNVGNVSL